MNSTQEYNSNMQDKLKQIANALKGEADSLRKLTLSADIISGPVQMHPQGIKMIADRLEHLGKEIATLADTIVNREQ
jgi:peptidoglycan hydrolase CwlO-like protein